MCALYMYIIRINILLLKNIQFILITYIYRLYLRIISPSQSSVQGDLFEYNRPIFTVNFFFIKNYTSRLQMSRCSNNLCIIFTLHFFSPIYIIYNLIISYKLVYSYFANSIIKLDLYTIECLDCIFKQWLYYK